MGKKRSSDGKLKPSKPTSTPQNSGDPSNTSNSNKTPPCAQQSPIVSSKTTESQTTEDLVSIAKKQKLNTVKPPQPQPQQPANPKPHSKPRSKRQKLPPLPAEVTVTRRPIHHPAIPTPYHSSDSPKTLYIKHRSPFIPTLKRIRRLLSEIAKRHQQSVSASHHPANRSKQSKPLAANGRLNPADVEKDIVEGSREEESSGTGIGDEEVFLKATGRAIERALAFGCHFQGEDDCRVRVEMGSVQAIDDLEVLRKRDDEEEGEGGGEDGEDGGKKVGKKGKERLKDDIPETRVRSLSSITVAIGLK
jgi:ribonuclease P/MRP protein subunit POP7